MSDLSDTQVPQLTGPRSATRTTHESPGGLVTESAHDAASAVTADAGGPAAVEGGRQLPTDSLNVAFPQYGARTPALATGPHTFGPEMWLPEEMRQRLAGQPAGGALLHLHPPGGQATLPVPSDMRPGFATQGGAEQQRGTEERSPLPLNGGFRQAGKVTI
ncbi:hypothetical protein T492DRAFT_894944 [Pavlovales sp. CCMP2436]|nr:hypothetical protein T492DRAFT_894944 [Pavlovales sp. CCMP2436]